HLRDRVRRDIELEEGLHYRRGDRVVAASSAERGHAAFIVARREAERVALEARVNDLRLRNRGHAASPRAAACSSVSTTQRQSIGKPPYCRIECKRSGAQPSSIVSRLLSCASRFCSTTKIRSCCSTNSATSSPNG